MNDSGALDRGYRFFFLLMMPFCCVTYLAMTWIIILLIKTGRAPGMDTETLKLLRVIFLGIAAADFLFCKFIMRRMARDFQSSENPRYEYSEVIRRCFSISTVGLYMCFSPVVFGFALSIVSGKLGDFWLFSLIAAFMIFLRFPRKKHWIAWTESCAFCESDKKL